MSDIQQVDPSDEESMRAAYDVWRAANLVGDPDNPLPSYPEILVRFQTPSTSYSDEMFLLRDADGASVGCYWLEMPLKDNLDMAEVDLAVRPEQQGRGHGRRLLDDALARITRYGRHQVLAGTGQPPDGGDDRSTRFAAAAGARHSLGEVRRTLELETLDHPRLAELRADAESHADGYHLVGWTGPCPDDLVDDYAALVGRMSTDAPLGDLGIEPEHWDAARIRERDDVMARQGRTEVATAVRAGEDGPLVAYTDIVITRHDPVIAFQWDTLVRREDRGHRLGTLVKVANLQRLLDVAPVVKRVHTWNADVNPYMVAINEAMGFQVARQESAWRLDLPASGAEVADHG
ncbi:MAG: GNAT family N-acetyltransferase [Sporichthyaceae bacterium]